MKTLLKFIFILCIGMTAIRCTENESPATVEKVQFAFNTRSSADDGARLSAVGLPSNASVLVTIENSAGETVLDHHMIDLLKVGDRYMSKPIDLIAGNYKLVDFMIVNDDNEVLYAAPKHGSPLASAVTTPVPFSFYVSKDNVSNIPVEVVDVQGSTPEAFGYVSFDISIQGGRTLQIAIMAPDGNGYSLTAANVWLLDGNDTITNFNLGAKINTIHLPDDSLEAFYLVINKDGFHLAQRWIRYDQLMEELEGSPLAIYLRPDTEPRFTHFAIDLDIVVDTVDPFVPLREAILADSIWYDDIPELPEYNGHITVYDHVYFEVQIINDSASFSRINNIEGYSRPIEIPLMEQCGAVYSSGDLIDMIGGSGYMSHDGDSVTLHLNLEQRFQSFFVTYHCYWIDYAMPVVSLPGDYFSNLTIKLSDEDTFQSFTMKDGAIQVHVQPLGPY